jgi:hypothetical protein
MDFQEAEHRYAELRRQYDNGDVSDEEFQAQHAQITVRDPDGRLWSKHRDTGEWHYYDGSAWVPGTPPIDDRNGRDNGKSDLVEVSERSSAGRVVLWVLTILCAVLVIVTIIRGPGLGYFTALFVVLTIIFAYLLRRRESSLHNDRSLRWIFEKQSIATQNSDSDTTTAILAPRSSVRSTRRSRCVTLMVGCGQNTVIPESGITTTAALGSEVPRHSPMSQHLPRDDLPHRNNPPRRDNLPPCGNNLPYRNSPPCSGLDGGSPGELGSP